jgi:hypothetical protein
MTDSPEKLEQFVDRLVREQPLRRAPTSLEARVFAQVAAQRARTPWWRCGFAHWPLVARAVFLVASYGLVRLAIAGVVSVTSLFQSNQITAVAALRRVGDTASSAASVGDTVVSAIPPAWLYGLAIVALVLYASLFGLGTFAYRTLYVQK